jgi:hypothetical protein
MKNNNVVIIRNDTDKPKHGFKRKTIVQNIKNKMNKWIASIEDEELRKRVKYDYIVTGGAITSMLLGELPNDYDVYFKTPQVALDITNYYIGKVNPNGKVSKVEAKLKDDRVVIMIKSAGIIRSENDNFDGYDYFEATNGVNIESYLDKESFKDKKYYTIAMISSNAISLHGDIQLITRFIGDPEEIHKNYDFVHVTNWFTEDSGLVLNDKALESILAKELRYVGSLYPICSLFRVRKFLQRGFTITAGEILKISYDISKLDLNDMNVFMEQLCGVDAAYFHEIIEILKKNSDRPLDRSYLHELINRVFDETNNETDEFHDFIDNE